MACLWLWSLSRGSHFGSLRCPLWSTGTTSLPRQQLLADCLVKCFSADVNEWPLVSQESLPLLKWLQISTLDCNLPRADFGHLVLVSEVLMDVRGEESEKQQAAHLGLSSPVEAVIPEAVFGFGQSEL